MFRGDVFAHQQEQLTVFTAFVNADQCYYRYQPAAKLVSITKSCKYSQLLLLMSENIARSM